MFPAIPKFHPFIKTYTKNTTWATYNRSTPNIKGFLKASHKLPETVVLLINASAIATAMPARIMAPTAYNSYQ